MPMCLTVAHRLTVAYCLTIAHVSDRFLKCLTVACLAGQRHLAVLEADPPSSIHHNPVCDAPHRAVIQEGKVHSHASVGATNGEGSLQVIEAKEYVSRPPKLGLGARPAEPESRPGKRIKPGEQRQPKKDMVYYDEHGVQKHVKTLDAKLVEREREGPYPGKTMRLVAGHHAGLLCIVLAIEPKV